MVSYIVSAFNRPDRLPCCLWSLKAQTDQDFEVIVADNSIDPMIQALHRHHVRELDARFRYVATEAIDCYWSAELLAASVKGDWLCFPSDDSYYMPLFQEELLRAAQANAWRLVYCNMIFARPNRQRLPYAEENVRPEISWIDKTGFLVRREDFSGFPNKVGPPATWASCDGQLIEQLVRNGVPHGKAPGVLAVHN